MGQNRNMPSKKKIVEHWQLKYNLEIDDIHCWACGFPSQLDRAHLKARYDSSLDTEDNLVLLCRHCHWAQEPFASKDESSKKFKELILDGLPFFSNTYNRIQNNVKLGLYDSCIEETSISNYDFEEVKKFLNKKLYI